MAKEFNPTREDLLNLERLILDVKEKKRKLVERKLIVQNSLSRQKKKYSDTDFESEKFFKIKKKRAKLKEIFNEIELDIQKCNEEIDTKNKLKMEVEHHLSGKKLLDDSTRDIMTKIAVLKHKYSEFTKDRTRIASLRVLAAEFVEELNKIVK